MKTTFELTLYEDMKFQEEMLNRLEIAFDDPRNILPDDYFYFSDNLPYGSKVRITFEVIQ